MSSRIRGAIVVGIILAVVVTALVVVGIRIKSNWDSFVPDIIVGVIGAGSIAALIAWIQWSVERRRSRDEEVTSAYRALLDATSELRGIDWEARHGAGTRVRFFSSRMLTLSELMDSKEPWLALWFDAQRQLMLFHAGKVAEAMKVILGDDIDHGVDDVLEAQAPLDKWTAEFTHNLRFWRTGKASRAQMERDTKKIEAGLREQGAWRDSPLPWRKEFEETTPTEV